MSVIVTHIDYKRDLTEHTATGSVNVTMLQDKIRTYFETKSTSNVLWDFSRATFEKICFDELVKFTDLAKRYDNKTRKVAVVCNSPYEMGVAKIYQILAEMSQFQTETFLSECKNTALDWLK